MPDAFPVGPYKFIEMGSGSEAPWYIIPFNEHGHCVAPSTQDHLLSALRDDAYTDIFLFSHGWNNDWHKVVDLYENFIKGYSQMQSGHRLTYRRPFRPLLIGVFWPSISLVLPWEQGPTFAPFSPSEPHPMSDQSGQVLREIEEIAAAIDDEDTSRRFYSLALSEKDLSRDEALELAEILVPFYNRVEDELPSQDPSPAASDLVDLWRAGAPDDPQKDTSGKFRYAFNDTPIDAPEAAGDLHLDPRWPIRLLTVRRMKDRAGIVGAHGVGGLLGDLSSTSNTGRLHLIGHSYGCKVLLSALCFRKPPRPVSSLLLLQPAVSYLCFAKDAMGAGHPGGYRVALERVEQPILTTFSPRDKPLTAFFHRALWRGSDFAEKRIAGPPPSRYAALGGYGPGGCKAECQVVMMKDIGEDYNLEEGTTRIYALNGAKAITSHGDISNRYTWWALFNQVTC